jgi:hypothetical protein
MLPEVSTFLSKHWEFGTPAAVKDVPKWEKGKRQIVTFKEGKTLLFYEKSGNIATVFEGEGIGRKKVWGEYEKSN